MAAKRTTILVLLFYWLSSVDIRTGIGVMAQQTTTVEVTAPLNPVKEGDILSVHCKIKAKDPNHDVMITRLVNVRGPDGRVQTIEQRLTSENTVIWKDDSNRMFIAKRLLRDSSNVYFLSTTEVTRADEARYVCTVMKSIHEVAANGSVPISIQYFPTESPTCTTSTPLPISVPERTELIFNCSSPAGFPAVSVTWVKSGEDTSPTQAEVRQGNTVSSVLTLRPTFPADNGGIWQCEVRSKVFRDPVKHVHRCHIGPIEVSFNPTTAPPSKPATSRPVLTSPFLPVKPPELTEECREFCRLEQEPTIFYWTIATVIAGILAVVFLIMGIIILIKYCMALHSAKNERGRGSRGRPDPSAADDVDAGVEFRRDDNRVYMSLDRSGRLQAEPLYQARGEIMGAHYILTPTRDVDGERQYIVTPTRDRPGTSQTEAVYQGGVVLERQVVGPVTTPLRGELERQQYIAGPLRDPAERQQYIATPIRGEGERPQYIATPIRGADAGAIGPQYTATPGTPSRGDFDRQQYIATAKIEAAAAAAGGGERPQYIATPALSEGERQYIVTPSQGGGMERHYLDTPTLPPRRYRSQYV